MEPQGKVIAHTKMRVAELVVNVSAVLEGSITDWPANIQDGIYKALADKCHASRADFQIAQSYSDNDIDTGPYVHVIAICIVNLQ